MFNDKFWNEYSKKRLFAIECGVFLVGCASLLIGGASWIRYLFPGAEEPAPTIPLLATSAAFFSGYFLLRTSRLYFKDSKERKGSKILDVLVALGLAALFFAIFIFIEFIEAKYLKPL